MRYCAWRHTLLDNDQIKETRDKSVNYLMNLFYSDIDMPVVDDKTIDLLEATVANYTRIFPACLNSKCRKIEEEIMQTKYKSYKRGLL